MHNFDVWMNGEWIQSEEARVLSHDLGLLRGWGAFDFFRTYGPHLFAAREHILRFKKSSAALMLDMPYSEEELLRVADECVARNYKSGAPDLSLRFVITAGDSDDSLTPSGNPTVYLLADTLHIPSVDAYKRGFSLYTVSIDRFMPEVKSTMYLPAIIALKQARESGADDALYVNTGVRECTTSNFFIVKNGRVITSADGILRGITLQIVCEIARADDILDERHIFPEELNTADEAFVTSTIKEILPVTKIDGHIVGSGVSGPITAHLQKKFQEFVKQKISNY